MAHSYFSNTDPSPLSIPGYEILEEISNFRREKTYFPKAEKGRGRFPFFPLWTLCLEWVFSVYHRTAGLPPVDAVRHYLSHYCNINTVWGCHCI